MDEDKHEPTAPAPVRRRDTGEPGNGGKYAARSRSGSGLHLDLDGVSDPWLESADTDEGWADELATMIDGDGASAEVRRLGREVTTAVLTPDEAGVGRDDRDAYMAAWDAHQAAAARLQEQFGSVELAVTHAGGLIAQRGFELAGITDEEVRQRHQLRLEEAQAAYDEAEAACDAIVAEVQPRVDEAVGAVRRAYEEGADEALVTQLLAAKTALQNERSDRLNPYLEVKHAARDALHMVQSGYDEDTRADVRQLTDGYLAALAEVRDLGGELVVADRSKPAAVRAFQEAAAIFPSEWVDASNDRIGGQKVLSSGYHIPDRAPVVKIGRSRAHYADVTTEQTKKRVPVTRQMTRELASRLGMLEGGASQSPYYEVERVPASEAEAVALDGEGLYKVTEYEVAPSYSQTQTRPRGRGWEQWTSPGGERTVWRRPRYRMETVEMTAMPEITTRAEPPQVAGRSATFAVCVHELSHRMEASVPGVKRLEEDFLRRRRTDPETGEEERLIRLYPRSKEYAYKDGFNIAYTGKVYEDGSREILSTGLDQVLGGRNGAGVGLGSWAADPEHRDFVLGLLGTVGVR